MRLVACIVAVSVFSCAAPVDEDVAESESSLIDAQRTERRPEVGKLTRRNGNVISYCTGTLIATNVVLTAAHCAQSTSFNVEGVGTFDVTARNSYNAGVPGPRDVAVLRLGSDVPITRVHPAALAPVKPEAGAMITTYGYGCTQRGASNGGAKRLATYPYLSGREHLCPGDSGGPTFAPPGPNGGIFRVSSGFSANGDVYGDVVALRDEILAQVAEWGGGRVPANGGIAWACRNSTIGGPQLWTCAQNSRYRCEDGQPVREICANDCVIHPIGTNDTCK